MTLFEVMVAMFIFLVGIVGVLAALPTGVTSGEWVIFQDAAIHLSRSKFSEFRRDRANPSVDLVEGSSYMTKWQEPINSSGEFHDFNSAAGSTYQYFDDVWRYEWKVDQTILGKPVLLTNSGAVPLPQPNCMAPVHTGGGTDVGLSRVVLVIRQKGTQRELQFTEYMTDYGRVAPVDPIP
jgi:hypothetical protein